MEESKKDFEYFVLPEYEESWIQGYPLKTEYGYIVPIKVKDYFKYIGEIDFIKKQSWEIKKEILKGLIRTDEEMFHIVRKDFERASFMTCLKNNVAGLRDAYNKVFSIFIHDFNPDGRFYWSLNESDFDTLRKLILDFNHIPYHEKNPNEEIEKFNRIKTHIASVKGGLIEFDTIYSTLMTKEGGGLSPDEINNLTMRQFFLAFHRIEYIKGNEMTILFKTVDSKGELEVIDWNRSFRNKEEDNTFESLEQANAYMKKKIQM